MPSKLLKTPILPDKYYHIFNKANNSEKIFRDDFDYQFFLLKLSKIVIAGIDVYSFCLLPNHFHLLIKPKLSFQNSKVVPFKEHLRKFFQIYVQYYNEKYKRKGSLFLKSFRRIEINEDYYLKYMLFYIHYNPQKHNFIGDYKNYRFSSYRIYINSHQTNLQKREMLKLFDDKLEEFIAFHQDCIERRVGFDGTPSRGMESLT